MATNNDKYISELTQKTSSEITGNYSFVIQEPSGQANTTYQITMSEIVQWIQSNTNYTQIYSLPIEQIDPSGDTSITVIDTSSSPVGSPIPRTEVIRIKAASENVGIGTDVPQSKLEIYSSDATNGDLMITPATGDRFGFHVSGSDSDSSPAVSAYLHLGKRFGSSPQDASFVSLMTIDEDANTEIGIGNTDSILDVNGFTQLGSDAPVIKMKKLTGTTGSTGSTTSIAHGLTRDKIILCNVLVKDTSDRWITPNDSISGNRLYTFVINSTNVDVTLGSGDSSPDLSASAIESKDIVCTVIYEQ